MTLPKKPFSMRLIPRNRRISRSMWTIAAVLGLGLTLASCHREACPGQITQNSTEQPASLKATPSLQDAGWTAVDSKGAFTEQL